MKYVFQSIRSLLKVVVVLLLAALVSTQVYGQKTSTYTDAWLFVLNHVEQSKRRMTKKVGLETEDGLLEFIEGSMTRVPQSEKKLILDEA